MSKKDYYEILGVSRSATDEELKKAFRQKALQYHPDRNREDNSAEEKFKAVAEAYEMLRDPEKRKLYDMYGHDGLKNTGFGGSTGFSDIFSSFNDLFGEFFGFGTGRPGRQTGMPGADLRYDYTISFEDATFGKETEIEIEKLDPCQYCDGTGAKAGVDFASCPTCGGRGQVSRTQGFFSISTTCPRCAGQGQVIKEKCAECRGKGRLLKKKKIGLKIPPGVESGSRLRLQGEGEGGTMGGPPGDLYVVLHVQEHEFFKRSGNDIVCQVPISFALAALGGEIEVPTLNGTRSISIPKGTQSGEVFNLRGLGFKSLRGGRSGNQIVQVIVKTPEKLTKKQEELLREFAEIEAKENQKTEKKGFFKSIFSGN